MLNNLKLLLKKTKFYSIYNYFRIQEAVKEWERMGRPFPPPHFLKVKTVRRYAKYFSMRVFIETGTYMGEMIFAVKDLFKEIYSVELSDKYYARATTMFNKFKNIHIINGDSGQVLQDILKNIKDPTLFWLDAHYQGGDSAKGNLETPIMKELDFIISNNPQHHVILIDDARLFRRENDYPAIGTLMNYIRERSEYSFFDVEDDIIRITSTGAIR